MASAALYALLVSFFIITIYILVRRKEPLSSLPLPPGPPKLPLIGNIHQAPKSFAWLQYDAWAREYGPIVHVNMAGQSVIFLTSAKAAHDVLNKQGAIFSDRPHFVVASDLANKGMHTLLRPYDARFKLHLKLQSPLLSEAAAKAYSPMQELESKQLLFDLLQTSNEKGVDCQGEVQRTVVGLIYALFYSQRFSSASDQRLIRFDEVNHGFDAMVAPGAYLVDSFPWLNLLPDSLAPWRADAERQWKRNTSLHLDNLKVGREADGWNFAKQMTKAVRDQGIEMSEIELALSVGILINAAVDGSTSTAMWFITACIARDTDKSWIAKAQQQLDEVVGHNRMPTFADRANLPYISAISDEVMRWRHMVQTGVPHFTKVEATYDGYRIPKNSVVIANHYSIGRDEAVYGLEHDVRKFVPERWLRTGTDKLPEFGFGYGRRICPGRNVARNTAWILIARILWAFNVRPGLDETGRPLNVDSTKCTDGFVQHPLRFKTYFEPRGNWARELISKDGDPHNVDHASLLDQIGSTRDW